MIKSKISSLLERLAQGKSVSRKGLTKREYSRLLQLYAKQPWLTEREPALYELLGICSDSDDQLLIKDLLERFNYLRQTEFLELLAQMAKQVTEGWGLPQEETQIVAITADDDADSAQMILQMLKVKFLRCGWSSVKTVNRIGKSVKNLHRYPNIVFVDEFVGSGTTMVKRIRETRTYYENAVKNGKAPKGYDVKVCILASMEDAKEIVEQTGVEMYSTLWLKKGISGHLEGAMLRAAIKRMLGLESKLKPRINIVDLPSLGWGKAEALYSTKGGNTPNSVFPIFWWPQLVDGRKRQTLLHRQERGLL